MKKILCFGDSNTYGYNPQNGERYSKNERWSGLLKNFFKDKYDIIEAGYNNRTTFKNAYGYNETGYSSILEFLSSKISLVILFIGINDLQKIYNAGETDLKNGILKLIQIIQDKTNAKIILVSPMKLDNKLLNGHFSIMFGSEAIIKSSKLVTIYQNVAIQNNCIFVNLNDKVETSFIDGIHFDIQNHKKIFEIIRDEIIENISI